MNRAKKRKIAKARVAIERAQQKIESKQPRLEGDADEVYHGFMSFIQSQNRFSWSGVPPYDPNSIELDTWLQDAWYQEPLWSGVLNQATLVDSSRGWTLAGGRNQVIRFTRTLHRADGGAGWRNFFRRQALSYRATNFGATVELGRSEPGAYWQNGQWVKLGLQEIWHLDSSRCRWTGNPDIPLEYNPDTGPKTDVQFWLPFEFFNVCSMPNNQERFHGLGMCATYRALSIMALLYYVFAHDTEMLNAKIPDGLLILNNITRNQWKTAMSRRRAELDGIEREYFGGIAILAGAAGADAKLIGLSQLPTRFDRKMFIDQAVYAYSLIAGYDVREFWPASTGTLGTGTEAQEQHRKALTKGALELPHAWEEKMQNELPETISFGFTERDPRAHLERAEMFAALSLGLQRIRGDNFNPATLTREEERAILAQFDVIPSGWSDILDEAEATDTKTLRARYRENPAMQVAATRYRNEPLVVYSWPENKQQILWRSGDEFSKPVFYEAVPIKRDSAKKSRQAPRGGAKEEQESEEILYEGDDFEITEDDVTKAIASVERNIGEWLATYLEHGLSDVLPLQDALNNRDDIITAFRTETDALTKALAAGGNLKTRAFSPWELAMRQIVKESFISQFLNGRGGREKMTQSDWGKCGSQLAFQYKKLSAFAKEIEAGELSEAEIRQRSRMYISASVQAYEEGRKRLLLATKEIVEIRWVLNDAEHCKDCVAFADAGWVPIENAFDGCVPGSGCTKCLANCQCHLEYKDEAGNIW